MKFPNIIQILQFLGATTKNNIDKTKQKKANIVRFTFEVNSESMSTIDKNILLCMAKSTEKIVELYKEITHTVECMQLPRRVVYQPRLNLNETTTTRTQSGIRNNKRLN